MVKSFAGKQSKEEKYPYPTRYGSHASMIDEAQSEDLKDKELAVLTDEHGSYVTLRNRLDSGLADSRRYSVRDLTIAEMVVIIHQEK